MRALGDRGRHRPQTLSQDQLHALAAHAHRAAAITSSREGCKFTMVDELDPLKAVEPEFLPGDG